MDSLTPTEVRLYNIYTNEDDPAAFGSSKILYHRAKQLQIHGITQKKVKEFLNKLKIHQLFTPYSRKRKFKRSEMIFPGLNHTWFGDLFLFSKEYPRFNYHFTYIFLLVDGLSQFVMAKAMRTKSGKEVRKNLQIMMIDRGAIPARLVTDEGKGTSLQRCVKIAVLNDY